MNEELKATVKDAGYQEEIEMNIHIPQCSVEPVNQRIYCIEVSPPERTTKSNLILPNTIIGENKGRRVEVKMKRFFVVAVAEDCNVQVKDGKEKRKLQRGDEVYWFYPPEAIGVNLPVVFDWESGRQFIVFHETELGGVKSWTEVDE